MKISRTPHPDWQICAVKKKHNVVVKLLLSQTDVNLNLEDDQGSIALFYSNASMCNVQCRNSQDATCPPSGVHCAQRMRKTMMEKLKL